MKHYSLLFGLLLSGSLLQAQITQAEYDVLQAANKGKDKEKAASAIVAMEKKYPNDAAVLFQRGYYEYNFEGDYNKALIFFSNSIKADKEFIMAYLMRARVLSKKGIYAKAVEDLNVVIKLYPDNIDLLTERAAWYFSLQQYENALSDFLQIIKLDPSISSTYYDAANVYKQLGKKEEGERILKSAFSQKLDNASVMHCFYGRFLLGEKRFAEAMNEYKKAAGISIEGWNASEYNDAGVAFFRSNQLNDAIRFFEKAIATEPENLNYILNLADVAVDQKDWNKVMQLAKTALALNIKDPKANMMMAVALTRTGDAIKGKEYEAKAKQYAAEQNQ